MQTRRSQGSGGKQPAFEAGPDRVDNNIDNDIRDNDERHNHSASGDGDEEDNISSHSTAGSQDTHMSDIDTSAQKSAQDARNDVRKGRFTSALSKLVFGASVEQIRIETVRSSNARADCLRGLVCVFVGATGGIGLATAREMFRRTTAPKAYIVGRENGEKVVRELQELNSTGTAIFLQKDVSLLKNVKEACDELKTREKKINCLVLTTGYLTMRGRDETSEGLDRKMVTNFYSRMKWTLELMPLLTAASQASELSRVITVLAAGSEEDIDLSDLDLRRSFALHTCLAHCVLMTDFMVEELAKKYPGTSFSHSYPGSVKTGVANELSAPVRLAVKLLYTVMTPWIMNVQETGERHFFQITSNCYPARAAGAAGIMIPHGLQVMRGSDGQIGSGSYLLDWDGKPGGDEKILRRYRAIGFGKTVWEHVMNMFAQAEGRTTRSESREPSIDSGRQSRSPSDDPVGWRNG